MVAVDVRPAREAGKLNLCKTCRRRKPAAEFGPPVRKHRLCDDLCRSCRQLGRQPHVRDDGPCRKCGAAVVRNSQGERKCPACFALRRKLERQRAANRAGKSYSPGVPFWQASPSYLYGPTAEGIERRWRQLEVRNAIEAWRWWLGHAPAWWLAARDEYLRWRRVTDTRYRDPRLRAEERGAVSPYWRARELRRRYCPYCGCELRGDIVALDHMDPIALGGRHVESNLIACCQLCNWRKHAKPFPVWLGKLVEPYRSSCQRLYEGRKLVESVLDAADVES